MATTDNSASGNQASTDHLRALVGQLSAADLRRSLGGGWTVGFALVHIAFWDARQVAALQRVAAGEDFPSEDIATNATLAAIASTFDLATVGQAAVEAAQALDTIVASLSDQQITALRTTGKSYAIDRAAHREEHMHQIEDAIA